MYDLLSATPYNDSGGKDIHYNDGGGQDMELWITDLIIQPSRDTAALLYTQLYDVNITAPSPDIVTRV